MSWRDKARKLSDMPPGPLTKLTKGSFVSSVSNPPGTFQSFQAEVTPLSSPGADTSARAVEARQQHVEAELAKHPERRVAFDAADVPVKLEPGEPVSVVLAVRTPVGIVSGELRIPRERFDAALFVRALETSENPS